MWAELSFLRWRSASLASGDCVRARERERQFERNQEIRSPFLKPSVNSRYTSSVQKPTRQPGKVWGEWGVFTTSAWSGGLALASCQDLMSIMSGSKEIHCSFTRETLFARKNLGLGSG